MSTSQVHTQLLAQRYCRGCGYDLRAQQEPRCPECGRAFDPANPRSFRRKPPRSILWRWGRRALAGVLVLALLAGGTWGWFWWGWSQERDALARMGGKVSIFSVEPLLGPKIRDRLGKAGFVLDRSWAMAVGPEMGDADAQSLGALTQLQVLGLSGTGITDAGLVHLQGLTKLQDLDLRRTGITDAGLVHLKGLTQLQYLNLSDAGITDEGLVHLQGLTKLQVLYLSVTRITDAGLVHLKGLTQLQWLDLSRTRVTDAGLVHLKGLTQLTSLDVSGTQVTAAGVSRLRAALPNLRYVTPWTPSAAPAGGIPE